MRNLLEFPCARLSPRYMKYLYAYECEKKSLSSPAELQAAIDGNRREGRRPSYSSSLFSYSPTTTGPPSLLSPPKIRFPIIGVAPGSGTSNPRVSPAAAVRKGQLLLLAAKRVAGLRGAGTETQLSPILPTQTTLDLKVVGLGWLWVCRIFCLWFKPLHAHFRKGSGRD